jgi:hypothetical protein
VTGPLATRRQRPRRRITPNTNTTTTTMISTHNHVDMAASLVGAGAIRGDATAAHPSKQLGHRQASSRARVDGRATRRLAGPGTLRPARRSGLAGAGGQTDSVPVKPALGALECSLAPWGSGAAVPSGAPVDHPDDPIGFCESLGAVLGDRCQASASGIAA